MEFHSIPCKVQHSRWNPGSPCWFHVHSRCIPHKHWSCSRVESGWNLSGFIWIPGMFQVFSRCFPLGLMWNLVGFRVDSRYVPGVFHMFSKLFQGGT